jgi:hypothetical protein
MLAAVASPASRSTASVGGEHPSFAMPVGAKSALPSRTQFGVGAGRLAPLSTARDPFAPIGVGLVGLIFVELIRPGCGPPS